MANDDDTQRPFTRARFIVGAVIVAALIGVVIVLAIIALARNNDDGPARVPTDLPLPTVTGHLDLYGEPRADARGESVGGLPVQG